MRTFRQPAETFSPYDHGAPRVLPDTSTPARAKAVEIEDSIRRDDLETGVFISPSGDVILSRTGTVDRVGFSDDELMVVAGATFTHNHPSNGSFSIADYMVAHEAGIRELRAVSPLFRHVMLFGNNTYDVKKFISHAKDISSRLSPVLRERVRTGDLRISSVGLELDHLFWMEMSKELGFKYWRELS